MCAQGPFSSDPQVRQNSPENKDGGQILKTGSNDQDEEWEETSQAG